MCNNVYLKTEAKKCFKEWTKEGLEFLLHNENYKDIAIDTLAKLLDLGETIEFTYNSLYYEIFESADSGYIVNVYSCDKKDEYDCFLDKYNIDGGLCSGSSKDAVKFMM